MEKELVKMTNWYKKEKITDIVTKTQENIENTYPTKPHRKRITTIANVYGITTEEVLNILKRPDINTRSLVVFNTACEAIEATGLVQLTTEEEAEEAPKPEIKFKDLTPNQEITNKMEAKKITMKAPATIARELEEQKNPDNDTTEELVTSHVFSLADCMTEEALQAVNGMTDAQKQERRIAINNQHTSYVNQMTWIFENKVPVPPSSPTATPLTRTEFGSVLKGDFEESLIARGFTLPHQEIHGVNWRDSELKLVNSAPVIVSASERAESQTVTHELDQKILDNYNLALAQLVSPENHQRAKDYAARLESWQSALQNRGNSLTAFVPFFKEHFLQNNPAWRDILNTLERNDKEPNGLIKLFNQDSGRPNLYEMVLPQVVLALSRKPAVYEEQTLYELEKAKDELDEKFPEVAGYWTHVQDHQKHLHQIPWYIQGPEVIRLVLNEMEASRTAPHHNPNN